MFPSFVSKTRVPTSSRLFPSFCKCFVHEVVCVLSQRSQVRWPFLMHWGVYCISAIKEFWHSLGPEHSLTREIGESTFFVQMPFKTEAVEIAVGWLVASCDSVFWEVFGRKARPKPNEHWHSQNEKGQAIDGHSMSMYVATIGSVKWVEHGRATAEISWGLTSLAWSRISLWPWDGSEPVRKGPWSWSRDDISAAISCIFQKQNKHMP